MLLIYTEKRLGGSLASLKPGEDVKVYLRTVNFDGSTSQAIVLYNAQEWLFACLGIGME